MIRAIGWQVAKLDNLPDTGVSGVGDGLEQVFNTFTFAKVCRAKWPGHM